MLWGRKSPEILRCVSEEGMCLGFLGLQCTSNFSDWYMNYRCVKFYGDAPAYHLWVNQSLHGYLAITFALLCLADQSIELWGPLAEMIHCKAWSSIHVHLHPLIPPRLLSFCSSWLLFASLSCLLTWSIYSPLVDFGPWTLTFHGNSWVFKGILLVWVFTNLAGQGGV